MKSPESASTLPMVAGAQLRNWIPDQYFYEHLGPKRGHLRRPHPDRARVVVQADGEAEVTLEELRAYELLMEQDTAQIVKDSSPAKSFSVRELGLQMQVTLHQEGKLDLAFIFPEVSGLNEFLNGLRLILHERYGEPIYD